MKTFTSITEKARANAEEFYGPHPMTTDERTRTVDAFMDGAEFGYAARAAEEPSDEQVEAAARALASWDGASGWETPAWDGHVPETAYRHGARRALRAARNRGLRDCWTYHQSEGLSGTETNPYTES